ncbi:diphthine--ammonia ligase [Cytobacillus sp. S13-E01]|uniref:Dph6-related ATP pyrophosphatase n=1 Tax=Cytobacillus sp. S13-E01 TaxID=3031326 RepID=UPI0023D860E6|nr:diphthine--ammonia ligase [Cytobacillus sp. S13-E01]MDF0725518.1 diphthine--ammonia ligase [Cytobacillus sp. S13-E01]
MAKKRIVISFSGGKDSTLALHRIIQAGEWEIDSLLTTVNEEHRRSSIHGVRESLLEAQAFSLGIPLRKVFIPAPCSNEMYENIMSEENKQLVEDGVTHMMFGDIFLVDVKTYRENMLANTSITPVFPLWNESSTTLIDEFLTLGYKTVVTCIDSEQLNPSFVGKIVDKEFLSMLPSNVDPCGENGEFHTFVLDGPIFNEKIDFSISDKNTVAKDVYTGKNRFYYVDLIPN